MSLAGFTVILTRPKGQAAALQAQLEKRGATVRLAPLLEVNEIDPKGDNQQHWDDIIFVSPNAVKWGMRHVNTQQASIFAIGPSTARALHAAGVEKVASPSQQFNSEALAEDPRLANVHDHRIAIVKGRQGREYLQDALTKRGAHIKLIDVYERHGAVIDLKTWCADAQPIISLTSVAALEHLHTQIKQQDCETLFATPVVVSSARMVKRAKELGFDQVWCGADATDSGLLDALEQCAVQSVNKYG